MRNKKTKVQFYKCEDCGRFYIIKDDKEIYIKAIDTRGYMLRSHRGFCTG